MQFEKQMQPLLQKYCLRCHNVDNMESGVRVDQLTATPEERHLFFWKDIQKQVDVGAMPPADEPQLTADERTSLVDWITRTIDVARSRNTQKNGSVRRLTVSQYRNTLKDLLGLEEDLTDVLPPDGISKEGICEQRPGHGHVTAASRILFRDRRQIARSSDRRRSGQTGDSKLSHELWNQDQPGTLSRCVDSRSQRRLLNTDDFVVTELHPQKPFAYEPFSMRTAYDFIEGYVGNDTLRGWRKFDSINHSVFACVRGTMGYPKGEAYQVVEQGLLLRPALASYPRDEILGQAFRYGPMANFKISLRELPDEGNFRVTVKAARYVDGLLLNAGEPVQDPSKSVFTTAVELTGDKPATVSIAEAGIYQVDVGTVPSPNRSLLSMTLSERQFSGQLFEATVAATNPADPADAQQAMNVIRSSTAFLLVRLPAGEISLTTRFGDGSRLHRVAFTKISDETDLARRFALFETRSPRLSVYLGLRRDCGSTLAQVGEPRLVAETEFAEYVFQGAIKDFPSPDVEKDNVNYLAGIREIGVRSEATDGRDMPRLLISSIEFEGPYFSSWPPETHRKIFQSASPGQTPAAEARDVIGSFATRAFRRPITAEEDDQLFQIWQTSYAQNHDTHQSIKNALTVVLTSPQFLFLIENSSSPEPEELNSYELASKLSYFLWNTAPDQRLLDLAATKSLQQTLDTEIDRMIGDPRFGQFVQEFGSQWFSLDKFDVVAVDPIRYPALTLEIKKHLRQEPIQFLRYLIEQNRPVRQLVQSDFIVANEVVANYYKLADRTESGFQFVPVKHDNAALGGVLSQTSILAGLSDGRESNPIKRGAWLARKIIADPPDDPPPNVPQLKDDDTSKLTLREKLERHRNQKGCVKCHTGIDPWGVPFEMFDAAGMLKEANSADPRSVLPDGTIVNNLNELKAYLADQLIDQVAFSFLKHMATYAVGRSLTYNELAFLREQGGQLKSDGYRIRNMVRFVIKSDLFLTK